MFALCPHCQFLVTVDPRTGHLPSTCPGCGEPVDDAGEAASAAPAAPAPAPAPRKPAVAPAEPAPRKPSTRKPATGEAAPVRAKPAAAVPKDNPATLAGPTPRARAKRSAAADDATPAHEAGHEGAVAPASPVDTAPSTAHAPQGDATGAGGPTRAADEAPVPPDVDTFGGANADAGAETLAADDPKPAAAVPESRAATSTTPVAPVDVPDAPAAPAAAAEDDATAGPAPAPEPDAEPESESEREREPELDLEPATTPATAQAASTVAAPARPARTLPRFLDRRVASPDAPGRRARLLTWGAVGVLSVVLVLQLLLADRARLAADAGWRPMLATLCGALGCSLPPWREPAAFTMLSRDVHANPARPGTLRVSASFRNDARWAQPWPSLLLTLSDLDGRTAGARVFVPAEYVGADAPRLLAPGQSANVTLDVVEPAPRIVAFTFDFR